MASSYQVKEAMFVKKVAQAALEEGANQLRRYHTLCSTLKCCKPPWFPQGSHPWWRCDDSGGEGGNAFSKDECSESLSG